MKKGIIKTLLFVVLILLAIVLGRAAATAFAGIRFLSWLGTAAKFGVPTVTVNLAVLQVTFGMSIDINVAQALLLLFAILLYMRIQGKG